MHACMCVLEWLSVYNQNASPKQITLIRCSDKNNKNSPNKSSKIKNNYRIWVFWVRYGPEDGVQKKIHKSVEHLAYPSHKQASLRSKYKPMQSRHASHFNIQNIGSRQCSMASHHYTQLNVIQYDQPEHHAL